MKRALSLLLIFCLGLPAPALALRAPNPKDSPPLEQALTAGMEEKEYEWAYLKDVLGLKEHLQNADKLDDYEHRLIKHKGRYYLLKESRFLGAHNQRAVWDDINRPDREYAAFVIARALLCNVCDVVIPDSRQRKELAALLRFQVKPDDLYLVELSTNYSLKDRVVIQKDPKKEFTRRLVTAFLIRYWDLHHNNTGPLKDSHEVRMMFDMDQAFHEKMASPESYLLEFALNFDMAEGSLEAGGVISTRNEAEQDAGVYRVDPLKVFDAMDPDELRQAFKDAKRLDLDKLEEVEGRKLIEKYGDNRNWTNVRDGWEKTFRQVKTWQASLHKDLPKFFEMLTAETVYPQGNRIEKRVLPKIDPDDADHVKQRYRLIQATLRDAQREMGPRRSGQGGLEEKADPLETRIRNELEDLKSQAERRLGVRVDPGWNGTDYPGIKMTALADTFLNHPDPVSVRGEVRDMMRQMNRRILVPLLQAGPGRFSGPMEDFREMALTLPIADDWLVFAYSPVTQNRRLYEQRTRALAVYSRRAAAEAFGRNGAHLRADFVSFDQADIATAPILLRGFLPTLQGMLARVQELRREGAADLRLERKAGEYAADLFNGLMIPGEKKSWNPLRDYRRYFAGWATESNGRLRPAIRLAASVFPDRFPADPKRMPSFIRFSSQQFSTQEIREMREFNRSAQGPPLTLWQLTAGTGAIGAYIRYLERHGEPLSRHRRLLEQVYGYLLEEAGVVPSHAAGAEERIGEIAAAAREAAQGGAVVIVDAAGVEEQPALQAFLERFEPLSSAPVVVLGDSPAARDLRENPGLYFAPDLGDLAGLLVTFKEQGITHAAYLSAGGQYRVGPVAREIGLSFAQHPVSLKTLLAGFMPAPLAAELAAGLEEAELLGAGA